MLTPIKNPLTNSTHVTKLHRLPRIAITFALAFILTTLAPSGHAQNAVLELNPGQTRINFTLGDVLHTVHGEFKLKRGTINFDAGTGKASGSVVVDATSGDSGSHARDHKMHKDVLESAEYPEISFAPQQVQGQVPAQGDFKVRVLGTFTMHGSSHPLALVIEAHLAGSQLTADTNFTIPYVNWGLKNPSTLFLRVNDTVDIAIHSVGQLAPGGRDSAQPPP